MTAPRVIVEISGGLCRAVYSDSCINVDVLDIDNMDAAEAQKNIEEYEMYKLFADELESGIMNGVYKPAW